MRIKLHGLKGWRPSTKIWTLWHWGLAEDIKANIQQSGRAMIRAVGPASTYQALKVRIASNHWTWFDIPKLLRVKSFRPLRLQPRNLADRFWQIQSYNWTIYFFCRHSHLTDWIDFWQPGTEDATKSRCERRAGWEHIDLSTPVTEAWWCWDELSFRHFAESQRGDCCCAIFQANPFGWGDWRL